MESLGGRQSGLPAKIGFVVLAWCLSFNPALSAAEAISYQIEQITIGPKHHFFGYIGQSLTIPWNESGRYILSLRSDFHDHMPQPDEPADVTLIDTRNDYSVIPLDQSRAWNLQQGTMFYWNPKEPGTQFFFNDRDPETGKVFTVLYDINQRKRVKEYHFEDTPVGNGGVAPSGEFFLAINYARMDRLRPVTGYPEAYDWTVGEKAPDDDGIFRINVKTGEKTLIVSFEQLRDLIQETDPRVLDASLYINHTLWNRNSDRIYFFARGRIGDQDKKINVPCSVHPDGSNLVAHQTFIGGHPEWGPGNQVIGAIDDSQVLYDVDEQKLVGEIGSAGLFPNPEGDVSFSPDGEWFANGFKSSSGANSYVIYRMRDGASVTTSEFSRGPYRRGELRIDPAPRWNRTSDTLLVPGWTEGETRQLFLIRISDD